MALAGMSRYEVGRELGIASDEVLYIVKRLEVKRPRKIVERPIAICPVCGWQGVIALHKPSDCARRQTSAKVATCELCGWHDASHGHEPDHCPRCLRIKQMFVAGMSKCEIGRELGMTSAGVSSAVWRLEVERPRIAICPVCGWQGVIAYHKPRHCARYLRLKKMYTAGMSGRVIGRELGISRAAVSLATHRLKIVRPRRKVEADRVSQEEL